MPTTTVKHRVLADNARQIWQWFQERGGIAVWKSLDMSSPGRSWTTPLRDAEGNPMPRQDWRMEETPSLTITDPAEVTVDVPKEVKRFRVAVKMGAQGLLLKCSDASSRRIRRECAKAGEDSWYEFDCAPEVSGQIPQGGCPGNPVDNVARPQPFGRLRG